LSVGESGQLTVCAERGHQQIFGYPFTKEKRPRKGGGLGFGEVRKPQNKSGRFLQ